MTLPRDYRWVFSRDWNFIERAVDKSNLRESITTKMEKRLFKELKENFQLEDPFPAYNRIHFSWDSRRQDGSRIIARLDRTYSFSLPGSVTAGSNYRILGDNVHSDHLPIWKRIWLVQETKRKSNYVMNAQYL